MINIKQIKKLNIKLIVNILSEIYFKRIFKKSNILFSVCICITQYTYIIQKNKI